MTENAPKTLAVTLVKSPIGYTIRQKATVRALGLRRMNQTVEHNDTPVVRGMLTKVSHLVRVEEKGSA
ncbi:MAG TPA: 50S ribosomal protein L30 [Anaerolineales bacterium]|nr:50S ribosomal protein L30 [Anaerolineales bacterium]